MLLHPTCATFTHMTKVYWWLLIILAGVYVVGPIGDPDLWWHIVVGRWILDQRQVPFVDYWNRFGAGHPWIAYSWSQEILYAFADRVGGIKGLLALQILFGVGTSLIFALVANHLSANRTVAAMLTCMATAGVASHFHVRPQTVTWLLFAVFAGSLEVLRTRGWSKKYVGLVLAAAILWANTHITVVFVPLLAALWLLAPGLLSPRARLGIWGCVLLSLLITPYGGAELVLALTKSSHPFVYSSIIEFGPATIRDYGTGITFILAVLLVFGVVGAIGVIPVPLLALTGLFIVAGLAVIKFLPFAIVMLLVLIASLWGTTQGAAFGSIGEGVRRLGAASIKLQGVGLGCLLIAATVVMVQRLWVRPLREELIPDRAVDFMLETLQTDRITNGFGDGGYLLYRLAHNGRVAAFRVPMDGRTNVNSGEVVAAYYGALYGRANWRDYLSITRPDTIVWRNASPLVALMLEAPEWCRVFREGGLDKGYSVFIPHAEWKKNPKLSADDCQR